jgi:hypothetical protein
LAVQGKNQVLSHPLSLPAAGRLIRRWETGVRIIINEPYTPAYNSSKEASPLVEDNAFYANQPWRL